MKLEIEELTARWDRMSALEGRTRAVVEANVATPCVRNARSLLACSLADAVTGAPERSRELEKRSVALEMRGYRASFASLRIRLALARGDLGLLEALVGEAVPPPPAKNWWALNTLSARLDALATLRDRAAVEAEAPGLAVDGTYFQPFALRALGVVRNDQGLLERAADRFEAMGLSWYAQETDAILRGASTA